LNCISKKEAGIWLVLEDMAVNMVVCDWWEVLGQFGKYRPL
jgi:hypothetical protein